MKDPQSAESKQKIKFQNSPIFYFSSYCYFSVIFVMSSPQFSMHFCDNSKNKNRTILLGFWVFLIFFIGFFVCSWHRSTDSDRLVDFDWLLCVFDWFPPTAATKSVLNCFICVQLAPQWPQR